MKSLDKQSIIVRYILFCFILILAMGVIVYKSFIIIVKEPDKWKPENALPTEVPIKGERGNIYSSDGYLLAATVPEFQLFIDFHAGGFRRDTFRVHLPRLATLFAHEIGDKTEVEYKKHLESGLKQLEDYDKETDPKRQRTLKRRGRNFRISPNYINLAVRQRLFQDPYFRKPRAKSGITDRKRYHRENPYGIFASRTIGNIIKDGVDSKGKSGLEMGFDAELNGLPGVGYRQNAMGRSITQVVTPPVNGADVIATIDISMQEIAEQALYQRLVDLEADMGLAVVMETKTGAIRAIANLDKSADGTYYEKVNHAVGDMEQPGSTIKTATFLIGIDDGLFNLNGTVDTEKGRMNYFGRSITDHNVHRGGYGILTVPQVLYNSSNIGVIKLVEAAYGQNPTKFIEGMDRIGLTEKLNIRIPGAGTPIVPRPGVKRLYWSKVSLGSISFGYETRIPPIQILAFYNAIANGGKMVKPIFAERLERDGEVIQVFQPEVFRESIASPQAIKKMQTLLRGVVHEGTARNIDSKFIQIAGKTGTAIIAPGETGYSEGQRRYRHAFCGYFPADNPQYSCIVVIRNPNCKSSGVSSGITFMQIAEQIQSLRMRRSIDEIKTGLPLAPPVSKEEAYRKERNAFQTHVVPNVVGMGLKDAAYLLEKAGLKVSASGYGVVKSQSIEGGTTIENAQMIKLEIESPNIKPVVKHEIDTTNALPSVPPINGSNHRQP